MALELAELTGFATFGALARSNRAEALAALGRHEEASADFLAAAETYDRLGSHLVMFPLRGLAGLQLTRGELGLARAGYERVLRISDETGTMNSRVLAQAGLARVLAGSDPARARALAAEALAGADGLVAVPGRLGAAWVLLYLGDVRARELADEAADIALSRRTARATPRRGSWRRWPAPIRTPGHGPRPRRSPNGNASGTRSAPSGPASCWRWCAATRRPPS